MLLFCTQSNIHTLCLTVHIVSLLHVLSATEVRYDCAELHPIVHVSVQWE